MWWCGELVKTEGDVKISKLTEEQKELVLENHNLIYSFLHSRHLYIDDWYDIAAIGLVKAGLNYNPDKGSTFSTYAYFIMNNEVLIEKRRQNAVRRADEKSVLYYDNIANSDGDGHEISFLNMIEDTRQDTEGEALASVMYYEFMSNLKKDTHIEIVRLLSLGYTQNEICEKVGCSQPQISRIRKKLMDKFHYIKVE